MLTAAINQSRESLHSVQSVSTSSQSQGSRGNGEERVSDSIKASPVDAHVLQSQRGKLAQC